MNGKIALCSALALRQGVAPKWVHLLPAGAVRAKDGRGPYSVRDAQALMSTSIADGKLPIDENHATDLAAPKGGPSPARGWIVELQQRPDGIWGRVEWTAAGRHIMQDREYRGLSPVIAHSADGTISAILRASLTNTPNLDGLTTLHSQELKEQPPLSELDAGDLAMIRTLGVDPHEYAKAKQANAAAEQAVEKVALQSLQLAGADGLSHGDVAVIRAMGLDRCAYATHKRELRGRFRV